MDASTNNNFRVITVKAVWGWCIKAGVKKVENRSYVIPANWIGKPVLIHCAKGAAPLKDFKKWVQIPVVRKAIETHLGEDMYEDPDRIYHFFQGLRNQIICIAIFSGSDVPDMTDEEYAFKDIPTPTKYHWTIEETYVLNPSVTGHRGVLFCGRVNDDVNQKVITQLSADQRHWPVWKSMVQEHVCVYCCLLRVACAMFHNVSLFRCVKQIPPASDDEKKEQKKQVSQQFFFWSAKQQPWHSV